MKRRKHITDGRKCWCNPKVISYKNGNWIPSKGEGYTGVEVYSRWSGSVLSGKLEGLGKFRTKALAQKALRDIKKVLKEAKHG